MSWTQLQLLLQEAPLDKEVKLMAIDALSLTQDTKIKDELIMLLLEWQASDKQVVETFETDLAQIVAETDKLAEGMQHRQIIRQTNIADEVGKQTAIEKLKGHIETL